MLSTTSYIFSTDTSASEFRRAVRRQVANRAEHALPRAGASAQELQQAYLRYMRQNNRGMRNSSNEAPSTYIEETEEAPPVYTATDSSATPTSRLNTLLYSNVRAAPSPPEYEDEASPPRYEDVVVAARTRSPILSSSSSSSALLHGSIASQSRSQSQSQSQSQSHSQSSNSSSTATNHLSHQNINALFAGSTSRTHRKQLNDTATQALTLVVGSDGPALPPREVKKGGWGRGKRRGMRGLRRV
jgi:hypothetical protein